MNRKTKWCHRLLALAMAAMMCCTYFPIGAFAETPPLQESTVVAEEHPPDKPEPTAGRPMPAARTPAWTPKKLPKNSLRKMRSL